MGDAVLMASGQWANLGGGSALQTIYVTRAFPYMYPVARLLGDHPSSVVWANIVTQIFMVSVFVLLCARNNSLRLGLVGGVLLLFQPESWFGTVIATHDVPAMSLYAVVLLIAGEVWRLVSRCLEKNDARERLGMRALLVESALVCIMGMLCGVLEVQRGYLPLILSGLLISLLVAVVSLVENRGSGVRRGRLIALSFHSVVLLLVWGLVSSQTASFISGMCTAQVPLMGKQDPVAHFAGSDAAKPAKWDNVATWAWMYINAVPERDRFWLNMRKIAYERICRPRVLWAQFLGKMMAYSESNFTLLHAVVRAEKTFVWEDRVAWYPAKYLFSVGITGVLSVMCRSEERRVGKEC